MFSNHNSKYKFHNVAVLTTKELAEKMNIDKRMIDRHMKLLVDNKLIYFENIRMDRKKHYVCSRYADQQFVKDAVKQLKKAI
ncbi:hypothetical protein P4640_19260 [Priestia aryabhattai]|uniref:hypothetical protein n=1 Tax=Priestia aryabhattai TaxID=412384 RepID=UPI002E211D3D|nr:hypothetical protein [Priestia aryabhattai]